MFSVTLYTLGCKLNQLESEALADAFRAAGFALRPWDEAEAADILIINTCTVTSKSDQKARRIIRKALRDAPGSCVIVAGCYAQLDGEALETLETECSPARQGGTAFGRRLFVLKGGANGAGPAKSALLDLPAVVRDCAGGGCAAGDGTDIRGLVNTAWERLFSTGSRETPPEAGGGGAFRFSPLDFSFHTRGFLKIQDGCDRRCTYCRVRLARGPSVSISAEQALAELRALEAKGYAEAVLSGVNITQYRDSDAGRNGGGLGGLLAYLLEGTKTIALRLSSLEPEGIDDELAAALARGRIRPHFHLSVQSGSAAILKKMGRSYTPETVERAAGLLRSVKANPFLACDIITGFPGETETEFEKTLSLCKSLDFAWIHAFPYSKRPGTPAFSFKEPVSEGEAARRVESLLELARRGRQNYARRSLGRETTVMVERGNGGKSAYCHGLSENYLKVLIGEAGPQAPPPGTALRCVLGRTDNPEFDAKAEKILADNRYPGSLL